jgi:hypothetical protein
MYVVDASNSYLPPLLEELPASKSGADKHAVLFRNSDQERSNVDKAEKREIWPRMLLASCVLLVSTLYILVSNPNALHLRRKYGSCASLVFISLSASG